MEPSASGRQIGWCSGEAPSPTSSALRVVRLNHTVPISWMPGGPPVDAAVADAAATTRARCGADSTRSVGRVRHLHVLQEGGRREEDGPDEERDVVRRGADGGGVERERAQREADGADGEQHPHPPVHGERGPPGRAAGDPAGVLAVPARIPQEAGAVGEPEDLAGHEGAEAPAALTPPSLGNFHVGRDRHGGHHRVARMRTSIGSPAC